MLTDQEPVSNPEAQTPSISPGNYSPVTVHNRDSVVAVFLGILTVILLSGWVRAEARYRELLTPEEMAGGNRSLNAR